MAATRNLDVAVSTNQNWHGDGGRVQSRSRNTARTSKERQDASRNDQPIQISDLVSGGTASQAAAGTILYLAYGSNLCAETFRGKRKITPLSQINVVVPQLSLTFDLPGLPYREPCFGNSRYRDLSQVAALSELPNDYHKDRWHKGMVGVVYEVTAKDYTHIIATEGGGSGYQDVVVDCYALDEDPTLEVPLVPTSTPFKAHTLFSPSTARSRPDPSYAQPSARYKKLITDGAEEHSLPYEYREYLDALRPYQMTTIKQRFGQALLIAIWGPIFALLFFGIGKIFLRKDGTYPKWYARLVNSLFAAIWISYDKFFKSVFGDGERTIGDETSQYDSSDVQSSDEKRGLLSQPGQTKYDGTNNAV